MSLTRVKIASRSSDLARWQAFEVERLLKQKFPHLETEMIFKSSFGDRNLDVPLSQMESRGVFTEDFYQDLRQGNYDVVVHSWKDLPVEDRAGTKIVATLPRADVRDVLLVPKEIWLQARVEKKLKILTSSPRRIYNLENTLRSLLPDFPGSIEFIPVRGNIPSRVDKMWSESSALILAKAALDRMLTPQKDLPDVAPRIREKVGACHFMVLPVSLNPTAPAQGALALEIAENRQDLEQMLLALNDKDTFENVSEERRTLKSYGGGCHQKIGMSVLSKPFGTYKVLKGLTDDGVVLNRMDYEHTSSKAFPKTTDPAAVFPSTESENQWFEREPLEFSSENLRGKAVLVSRAEPHAQSLLEASQIWTPGLKTWKRLAQKGVWVNGTFEGLGQQERHWVGPLGQGYPWMKLTHETSGHYEQDPEMEIFPVYRLHPLSKEQSPDLKGKKYFFWMSASSFQRARELYPEEIKEGFHGCGPGITARFLIQSGIEPERVRTYLSLQDFRSHVEA